jgi:hypothetical protein
VQFALPYPPRMPPFFTVATSPRMSDAVHRSPAMAIRCGPQVPRASPLGEPSRASGDLVSSVARAVLGREPPPPPSRQSPWLTPPLRHPLRQDPSHAAGLGRREPLIQDTFHRLDLRGSLQARSLAPARPRRPPVLPVVMVARAIPVVTRSPFAPASLLRRGAGEPRQAIPCRAGGPRSAFSRTPRARRGGTGRGYIQPISATDTATRAPKDRSIPVPRRRAPRTAARPRGGLGPCGGAG